MSTRLYGSDDPLPERIPLRAGPLDLVLESGDLRSIRVGGVEVINRIYGAVRDGGWATIPGRISELRADGGPESFTVGYRSEHLAGGVDFVWRAKITGAPDGTIDFRFSGGPRTTFARNRIGLCVLHPLGSCAGRPATARTTDGDTHEVVFPHDVAVEQPIRGFQDLAGLRWLAAPGLEVDLTLEGDRFETEDQRNWIDASYKTYGTPLALPRPVMVSPATRVEQRVVLRVVRTRRPRRPAPRGPDFASLDAARPPSDSGPLPRLGLGVGARPLELRDVAWLRALGPAHLRVDLPLGEAWEPLLVNAAEQASALGCGLELSLRVGAADAGALRRLAAMLPEAPPVLRILVFAAGAGVTSQAALDAVRQHLVSHRPRLGPLASGSGGDLYQLHLADPPRTGVTCWGMHPQAHATDLTSIAETPVAAGQQIRAVKARRPGAVAISPLRLHPGLADPRQASLFGAAWTLAVLAELAAAGADSVTLFETAGSRGVLADGAVFPLYHVIADFAELSRLSGPPLLVKPLEHVTGLLLPGALLLANLSRESRTVPLPAGFHAPAWRLLDATTAIEAMASPRLFRASRTDRPAGGLVTLPPFASARMDGSSRE